MKSISLFLILIISTLNIAQTIQLRGKVIDVDRQPVNNLTIRFTSFGEAITTGSGEFVITLPQDVSSVDVVLKDDDYEILYPVGSEIFVPSDAEDIITIIVSGINSEAVSNLEETVMKYEELEKILTDVGSTNKELKAFLDKFIELESKRLEISELTLKQEFEKKAKRNQIFSEVSPVLREYILRIKNLKTNFEMYFETSFVSNSSVEHLNSAIRVYNPTFDSINNNYKKWENEISGSWDKVLSENYAASVEYMIDELHIPCVFQLNEDIRLINNVRLRVGDGESRPDELKEEVVQNVNSILKNLNIKIPILENRFNEIITRMQHADLN